ncbi:MAG: hypothetical protein BWY80_00007 [Firmicutes bacterium ADurb.Bin456]|nr:MAG: hypothetical protein BWY80_00007 [Firmicutes bacterium ADurb.Bin456]
MCKEISFPEFIGETEQAVVLVVPSLEQNLTALFNRFYEGDEIDYWFNWELITASNGEYMVTLEIGWDGEEVIVIGFNPVMWEYLPVITRRKHLLLITDWKLIEEGITAGMDVLGRFRPKVLLVRDAGRGMAGLSGKVADEAMFCKESHELVQLLKILQDSQKPACTMH